MGIFFPSDHVENLATLFKISFLTVMVAWGKLCGRGLKKIKGRRKVNLWEGGRRKAYWGPSWFLLLSNIKREKAKSGFGRVVWGCRKGKAGKVRGGLPIKRQRPTRWQTWKKGSRPAVVDTSQKKGKEDVLGSLNQTRLDIHFF